MPKRVLTPFQKEAKRLYRQIRHAGTMVASQSYSRQPGEATPEALESAALRLEQTALDLRGFAAMMEVPERQELES
jgi:hypothetical protein